MYIIVFAIAILAGAVQTITGFGAAVVLMLVLPRFFDMVTAPAVSSAIAMGISISLVWKLRKHIKLQICLLPTAVYLLCSVLGILIAKRVHLEYLSVAFGVFLIALSVYFFVFSEKIKIQASWKMAVVCAMISGFTAGLFGIGGPLMAAYYISAIDDKKTYIASLQFMFAFTNVTNLFVRIFNGIFTANLLPVVLLGMLGVTIGKTGGLRILDKVHPGKIKKLVYAFVGVSGLLSLL